VLDDCDHATQLADVPEWIPGKDYEVRQLSGCEYPHRILFAYGPRPDYSGRTQGVGRTHANVPDEPGYLGQQGAVRVGPVGIIIGAGGHLGYG
jgi:hypothetical protein